MSLGPDRRRWSGRWLVRALVIVLVLGGAAGAGWWAALRFVSPAQRSAQAQAPPIVPVFAPVQTGTLSEVVTANASVATAQRRDFQLILPTDSLSAVVTANLATDGVLTEAAPVIAINDRPVFAVSGAFSFWRDLSPGLTGEDVRQVQAALRNAGYAIADREMGTFGRTTATAVRALYKTSGYSVATRPGEAPALVAATPSTDTAAGAATATPQAVPSPPPVLLLPASELVVIIGGLPAKVGALPPVGTILNAENAKVSVVAGLPTATADLPQTVASRAAVGTLGTLDVDGEGSVAVRLAELRPGDLATGSSPVAVIVGADPALIPESWVGRVGLLTLTLTTVADDSLLVPTRAIAVGSDGSARVVKRQEDGSSVVVPVRDVGELRGVSAVAPVEDGALKPGDQVQVG